MVTDCFREDNPTSLPVTPPTSTSFSPLKSVSSTATAYCRAGGAYIHAGRCNRSENTGITGRSEKESRNTWHRFSFDRDSTAIDSVLPPTYPPHTETATAAFHSLPNTMSSHIWILSVPIGFVNLLYPRILALVLCEKSGVKLDNANPRQQVEGKEVAMKDADG